MWTLNPKRSPRRSKRDPNNHLGSVQDQSHPKDGNEGNLPSAVETSQKGKEKVTKSSHHPDVDTDVDIPAKERRTLKIGMTANCLEMDPPLSQPPHDKLPMTTMLSNILEHHGRVNQRLTSLEEDLAHTKLEEEKLKAMIEALEKEKSEINAKVALMERKDLYDLLEAKMEGFQIANHPGTIGGFENLNLTITKKWMEIPTLNLEFKKCPADYPKYALLAEPLVKGLDADDFSMDKFFGLQDPTTLDDAQASPDFEEDLRTNERVRLRVEVRNLGAEPQWLTRSTRVRLEYEPTILPNITPTDNPARPVTLDLTVDAREDPSSLP
ncbi:hypothetical protein R1flu_005947 [Riccia fluitans]|uniref:Uncharacterized protein n=1 Tax=Riccia fluitans TaxID=41844 RepID=A0ABD1YUU4_9MARC